MAQASGNNTLFTAPRRDRLVELIAAGATLEAACADVGVSRTTVNRWRARGRRQPDTSAAAFAAALEQAQKPTSDPGEGPITEAELIRLLERQAREGSITAIKMLLERLARRSSRDTGTPGASPSDPWDDLDAATGDELAPRRRSRVRA